MGDFTELGKGGPHLLAGSGERDGSFRVTTGIGRSMRQAQLIGQAEEPLLGAIVEVSLDALPGCITGLYDPRSRGTEVAEMCEYGCSEAFVVDGKPGSGTDLPFEDARSLKSLTVIDECNRIAVADDGT